MTKKGFIDFEIQEDAKGMSIESLRKSRAIRAEFLDKYKMIPTSILPCARSEANKVVDLIRRNIGGGYTGWQKEKQKEADEKIGERIVSGFNLRGRMTTGEHLYRKKGGYAGYRKEKVHPKIRELDGYVKGLEKSGLELQGKGLFLSTFPQNIGRLMVDFYCPEKGMVYDPFAGHNSRMELVYRQGRSYSGVDCSHEFMEANREAKEILERESCQGLGLVERGTIQLIEGSSDKVDLPDRYADFTITSPPYWDIEYYGDEPEQLGNAKSYEAFLELLKVHVTENFRILKNDTYCCWFINDFRKAGVFYPYHADLFYIFCEVGFVPFNIYIVDLGNPINAAFVQGIIKTKLFPKRHEYCLVFRKAGVN